MGCCFDRFKKSGMGIQAQHPGVGPWSRTASSYLSFSDDSELRWPDFPLVHGLVLVCIIGKNSLEGGAKRSNRTIGKYLVVLHPSGRAFALFDRPQRLSAYKGLGLFFWENGVRKYYSVKSGPILVLLVFSDN